MADGYLPTATLFEMRGEHAGPDAWDRFLQREWPSIRWHVNTYETCGTKPAPAAGPVVVSRISGHLDLVIDGHHRLAAALELGVPTMPYVTQDM